MKIVNLKTEFKINPVGIDVTSPRLSWQILSNEKNIVQIAYQIHVTDPAGKFIWDSGKILSDKSVAVSYEGPTLKSSQRYSFV